MEHHGEKQRGYNNINAYVTYGTERANLPVLEDSLNLRDIRIYDTVTDRTARSAGC